MKIAKTKRANDKTVPTTLKLLTFPPLYIPYRLSIQVVMTSTYRIHDKQGANFFDFSLMIFYFSSNFCRMLLF